MPRRTQQNSATNNLLAIFTSDRYKLFTDQFNRPTFVDLDRPFIAVSIPSKTLNNFISQLYWQDEQKALRGDVVSSVSLTLESIARFSGEKHEVFNRVAKVNNTIYYDIGDDRNIVVVNPDGWTVAQSCPVFFRRYSHQVAQVLPDRDGADLKKLLDFLNLKEDYHELLILTYLSVALIPDIPRPIIILHGPQGAGKTTCLEMLRSIIDPSSMPSLSPARSNEEMIIQADHNYAYFLDNISSIRRDISDMLCRFVTGSAFSKRELYTNDDEYMYSFNRVVGMNGVALAASQPDLLDRSLLIGLERISQEERRRQLELKQQFELAKPKILGGLFDTLSQALRISPSLEFDDLPRMADYFVYASASAQALGFDTNAFKQAFDANATQQHEEAIEVSPVAKTILKLMDKYYEWIGNSTELYNELLEIAEDLGIDRYFPKSSSWLWKKIVEVKTNLEAYEITAELSRDSQHGRTITLHSPQERRQPGDTPDNGDRTSTPLTTRTTALDLLNRKQSVDRRVIKYLGRHSHNPFLNATHSRPITQGTNETHQPSNSSV